MSDEELLQAAAAALGPGFSVHIDRSQGARTLVTTHAASGTTYTGGGPPDSDGAGWARIVASVARNHYVTAWILANGPWTLAQAQAKAWPVRGRTELGTLPDGSQALVKISA